MNFKETVSPPTVVLRAQSGEALPLPGSRWAHDADPADDEILLLASDPVIDLGCGPGRHVEALSDKGFTVLGVEFSKQAVDFAQSRNRTVVRQSIFDQLPKTGEWGTVLLLDGNIGIGGDPVTLLERAVSLLRPGGRILIEVAPEGNEFDNTSDSVFLEVDGVEGPVFSWTYVTPTSLEKYLAEVGLQIANAWMRDDRFFALVELPTV